MNWSIMGPCLTFQPSAASGVPLQTLCIREPRKIWNPCSPPTCDEKWGTLSPPPPYEKMVKFSLYCRNSTLDQLRVSNDLCGVLRRHQHCVSLAPDLILGQFFGFVLGAMLYCSTFFRRLCSRHRISLHLSKV